MLAAGPDALLRVCHALPRRLFHAEEIRLELIHAGIGKEQRRIILRDDRRRGHKRMPMLLDEEVDELLADFVSGHHNPISKNIAANRHG